jgi:Protein tyrosine and serine/threonine kinase
MKAEASHPYLVLEGVRGLTLYEWARVHPATQRQVFRVVEQVAGALAVLHQKESLHRDVKGDNIAVAEARAVAREMPQKPLPGQRRAPCRLRGDVEIRGGCWIRKADVPAPCGVDAYEWQGVCYEPAADWSVPKTSTDPQ